MEQAKNLKLPPTNNLDVSRLRRGDYCVALREGWVYPAGFVRRMIAAYDDIAIERKIVGASGVVYSDFFDGRPGSMLAYKPDDPLDIACLVNQLGLEAIVFRPGDIADFPNLDLLAPLADLNLAAQCVRKGVPQICIAHGQNWIRRQKANLERADPSTNDAFVRDAQEVAGFGRLPVWCLNEEGMVPTLAPKSSGRPVTNEDFGDVFPSVNSLERMGQIAPHWFVDFLGSSHEFAVSISQGGDEGGILVAIDRAPRAIRLLTPLDPSTIGSRNLRAEITLKGSSQDEISPLVDGAYLVAMSPSRKPEIVSRIFGPIANEDAFKLHTTELKTPRIDPQLDLFFCIQLSTECKSINLASARLFEIDAPPRPRNSKASRSAGPVRKALSSSPTVKPLRPLKAPPTFALLNAESAVVDGANGKPRMAVICCNLGQNALGRAHTIGEMASQDYSVEVLGSLNPQHESEIWSPLRDTSMPIRGFAAKNMESYLSGLRALPASEPYNFVYVSKPRIQSLLLGMVLSARDNCPLALDVDDLELAFFQNQTPLPFDQFVDELQSGTAEVDNPAGEIWTRYCDTLARGADAITVSNEILRGCFGGVVLRHARDESKFFPDESVRADIRRSLGIRDREKVVLFLGSPRDHKGPVRVAEAIVRRSDPDLTMCVIGVDNSNSSLALLAERNPAFIKVFGSQPYARLPHLIQCADAICLLQDASSAISAFQSPAKLSEALAMGLPVLASRVAPFSDLISSGIVIPVDSNAELQIALDGIRDGRLNLATDRKKRISYFMSELSFAGNVRRLREALELASANFPSTSPARVATLQKLAKALQSRFGVDIMDCRNDRNVRSQAEEVA